MKRMYSRLLVTFLVLSLFTTVAFAGVQSDNDLEFVVKLVERTNESIASDIAQAQYVANVLIDNIGDNFISKFIISAIVDRLEFVTGQKAEHAIELAAKRGVEVGCEIIVVMVGGQAAYIDPLFVISD